MYIIMLNSLRVRGVCSPNDQDDNTGEVYTCQPARKGCY